jgi:uncharacterized membrane protein
MSPLSITHALIGLLALLLAGGILSRRKGDRLHRLLGRVCACALALSLASAILLGVMHVFDAFDVYAVISLCALGAAVAASRYRQHVPDWRFWHGALMCFTVLTGVAALSGVIGGIVIGDGNGPRYYRLFNILIVMVTVAGLLLVNWRLGKLLSPDKSRRPLWYYNAGVVLITSLLVAAQAP